jgi:hypothetical protein
MTTISVQIIADSISPQGIRITTYELEFPRFLLPQFNTHRLFSRNAQSSRAVPVEKMIEQIQANPATPIHWGKAQTGMQAKEECDAVISGIFHNDYATRAEAWNFARNGALTVAGKFAEAGYHKQIVNRLTEPFAHSKVVCTATEYDNFFWLRRHTDAQPEIKELADQMWNAREASIPKKLQPGEWHVPYFEGGWVEADGPRIKQALMVSSSCCAQVSYRRLDDSLEKAQKIFDRLIQADPPHFSPFEHQATPTQSPPSLLSKGHIPAGVTHFSVDQQADNWVAWSGNFRMWTQYRQLIMADKGVEPLR